MFQNKERTKKFKAWQQLVEVVFQRMDQRMNPADAEVLMVEQNYQGGIKPY